VADAPSRLWISQAHSDLYCAKRVYDQKDHRSYCQTLAKYQQTVEKSVKAVFAAARDKGLIGAPIGYSHNVEKLISVLGRLPRVRDNRSVQARINALLHDHNRNEIMLLCALAPRKPVPGGIHVRNTEYPYETTPGNWIAPVDQEAFGLGDVQRFGQLAERIYEGSKTLSRLIEKGP